MAETSTNLGRVSLVPRGPYSASATYNRLDIVSYEGSSYLVLVDGITGVIPVEGASYMLIAAQGDTGPEGTPGTTGPTGADGNDGVGIQSVERTSGDGSPGTTDTYTITLTNGVTSTFTVYNGANGTQGPAGADGTSFTVLGRYVTLAALKAAHPTGSEGDAWAVGSADDNDIYLWDVDAQDWQNVGSLQGPPGPAGADGQDGPAGANGAPGPAGADGKTAYEYAVDGGYTGSEDDFKALMGSGPWLPTAGGTMAGKIITAEGFTATGTASPSPILKPTTKGFAITSPTQSHAAIILSNDMAATPTFEFKTGAAGAALSAAPVHLGGIADPTSLYEAANKKYVDEHTGTAQEATKLETARTIQTNLSSGSAASFDGTQNVTPGVTGILPISKGGTGATSAANALANLGGLVVASNAGAHNSIFRGKNLGNQVTAAQYAAIAAGTFDDLFIGDYWEIDWVNPIIKYRIAAFDYYLNTGATKLTDHHVVLVPDESLADGIQMNTGNTTSDGYKGSAMNKQNINTARTKIKAVFANHLVTHQLYVSSGTSSGVVTSSDVIDADVVIMNERNVFGCLIMSGEYNRGVLNNALYTYDRTQFPLFALAPEFIKAKSGSYWLRDIVNISAFVGIFSNGFPEYVSAGDTRSVRPAFAIKG